MAATTAHLSALGALLALATTLHAGAAAAGESGGGPPRPEGLVVDPSETEVFIKWSRPAGSPGATSYEVLRGQSLVAVTTSLVASDGGLAPDSTYCYSVVAIDAEGRRSAPAGPVCERTLDTTPPSPPSALTGALLSPVEAALEWEAAFDNAGVAGYELLRGDRVVATVSEVHAVQSSLRPARRYCYAVRAFDRVGNRSPTSDPFCLVTPDVTPPSAPSQLRAEGGARRALLGWRESEDDVGVAGYEVLSGDEVVATVERPAAAPGGLEAGEHCFSVRAFDGAGNRSAASPPACAVVPDTTPPTSPEGLEAMAPGESSVVLRWQPSVDDVGVVGYEVLRGEKVVANSVQTAGGDEDLSPAREYCYRVRARDAAGNRSAPSSPACVATPDLSPPTIPAEPSARAPSDRSVRLQWEESSDNVGVAGYELLRDGQVVATSEGSSAEESGLLPAHDYCYAVRAYDRAGNRSPPSALTCARTPDLSPPTVPKEVVAAGVTPSRIALAWAPSSDDVGVAGYEVLRGEMVVARVAGPSAEVAGLSAGVEYCLSVRAFDAAENLSDPSPPACARTGEAGTPTAPGHPQAEEVGRGSVVLRWTGSPEPGVVYSVFWGKGPRIGATRFTSFKVSGLKPGERRCFEVSATDALGNSSQRTWPVCAESRASPSLSTRQ